MSLSYRLAAPLGFALVAAGGTVAAGVGAISSVGKNNAAPVVARTTAKRVVAPALSGVAVALTVGGGPSPDYNQVAIESNVRYVDSLLPTQTPRTILFANGDKKAAVVQYQEANGVSDAETALRFVLGERTRQGGAIKYRAPRLPRLDGPSRRATVSAMFDKLAQSAKTSSSAAAPQGGSAPYLLYFTGHGSQARNLDNNTYELWEKEKLSVREFSREMAKLPAGRAVNLVMVQCFSGAFGNALFENGDPEGALIDRPFCGFFAATRERPAAGCTPEVNEADYHDFTGYFFAALSGKGRTGNIVAPPDYDKNGVVGMNEAFAYALVAEPSMDVPVATSDVFLRRFAPVKSDDEIVSVPWDSVRSWASPAQKAALDGLSDALGANGADRLRVALREVTSRYADGERQDDNAAPRRTPAQAYTLKGAMMAINEARQTLTREYPDLLKRDDKAARLAARNKALAYLNDRPQTVAKITGAARVVREEGDAEYADALNGARWLRFLRLAKSVVLEHRLRGGTDKAVIARFTRLQALEAQNPLQKSPMGTVSATAPPRLDTRAGA